MKKSLLNTLALAVVLALLFAASVMAAPRTVVLHVPDMCASNEIQAQTVIEEIRGVSSVKTDMDNYTVTVNYDDEKTAVDAFKKALEGVSLVVGSVEEPQ